MVGSSGSQNPENNAGTVATPKPRVLECPSCGASVTVRCPGNSLSAVCDSCLTVLDTRDENVRILTRYFSKTKLYSSRIPFGTKGVLKGKKWECIGFVVRADGGSSFTWEEYLLFNPYYGYRWLTEANGHWSFVSTIKRQPKLSYQKAMLDFDSYRLFYRGEAEYRYVLGEFYWRIVVGTKVKMEDYIRPPLMLSCEKDDKEIVWSTSEYLEADEVAKAFNIKSHLMPMKTGVAANQPVAATMNWHYMLRFWLLSLAVLTAMQLFNVATSTSKLVEREGFTFVTNMKVIDLSTKKFTLTKPFSAIEIELYAPCDNSWVYVEGDIVDNKSGETYPIGGSVEFYHGYSDGEFWSEGGQTTSMTIPHVPAGEYYINMDVQSGDFAKSKEQRGYTLSVIEDVPQASNFWWSVFFVSIAPCLWFFASYSAEVQRWSESDYSPYASVES